MADDAQDSLGEINGIVVEGQVYLVRGKEAWLVWIGRREDIEKLTPTEAWSLVEYRFKQDKLTRRVVH